MAPEQLRSNLTALDIMLEDDVRERLSRLAKTREPQATASDREATCSTLTR